MFFNQFHCISSNLACHIIGTTSFSQENWWVKYANTPSLFFGMCERWNFTHRHLVIFQVLPSLWPTKHILWNAIEKLQHICRALISRIFRLKRLSFLVGIDKIKSSMNNYTYIMIFKSFHSWTSGFMHLNFCFFSILCIFYVFSFPEAQRSVLLHRFWCCNLMSEC